MKQAINSYEWTKFLKSIFLNINQTRESGCKESFPVGDLSIRNFNLNLFYIDVNDTNLPIIICFFFQEISIRNPCHKSI